MDYTSIHINGHLLSDDILRSIEQDNTLQGNRIQDFGIDTTVSSAIDYVWSALRNDWRFYNERSSAKDPYGTRRARDLMERLFQNLGYQMDRQSANITVNGKAYDINYIAQELGKLPFIVIGDRISEESGIETQDRCSLDYRAKGNMRRKSAHATMLEYLNSTENVYGIISNGQTLRLIRNSGQLVKVTYIEFDLRRMLEEDKYTEFCMMFRLLHASRFRIIGDEQCIMERWFNMSIESGNRIRAGLSDAVKTAMELIGNAAVTTKGDGNQLLREALVNGECDAAILNKELIHFIYRLLFLFIIEDRGLVYQIPENVLADSATEEFRQLCRWQELYKKYYQASRLRQMSELSYLRQSRYDDLWQGLMDTFHLFEEEAFGSRLGIKPLGGVLFHPDTLHYLKQCTISNADLLRAFSALNEFVDGNQQRVRINYSSLDVEEFGSVYEGILEMRPFVNVPSSADITEGWQFGFVGGLDRQSTSSYYTRPDLVQNLIRTTLEPVIEERLSKLATPEEKVRSLLSMKVCDAASGSGHIVLAMARTIAWHVCFWRTGEDNPASLDYREALREVIQRCVYAVDYNPDAVELCKVVLWIEGYCAGKPLSFLDHHIRCGNSVVGVSNLQMLIDGVPKEGLTAEDRPTLNALRTLNREAINAVNATLSNHNQPSLGLENPFGVEEMTTEQIGLAEKVAIISRLPENTLEQQIVKQMQWEDLMRSPRVDCLRRACDIYTYSFYRTARHDEILHKQNEYSEEEIIMEAEVPYTKTVVRALQEIDAMEKIEKGQPLPTYYVQLSSQFKTEVANAAEEHRYFHWCVEFPDVFAYDGGFDVMCGNPPWDKLQMEDEKWFVGKDNDIVNAANQSARNKKIAALETSNPTLFDEYQRARADIASQSSFIKTSGRFELSNHGKLDFYPLFAEHCLNCSKEAWGLVVPIGLITNDSCKLFFGKLIDENRLKSIYCFENREKLFEIDSTIKFCLLTAGNKSESPRIVHSGFYLTRIDHLLDPSRIYQLKTDDFALLNPNTKTCPIFRTSQDAELTAKIYHRTQILLDEQGNNNSWNFKYGSVFNMSTDSGLFKSYEQMIQMGAAYDGCCFETITGDVYVPLYEGKMIYLYNHHYGEFSKFGEHPNNASLPEPSLETLQDPNSSIVPYYWIKQSDVEEKDVKYDRNGNVIWVWPHRYKLIFKDVGRAGVARTFIIARVPDAFGVGNTATLINDECGGVPGLVLQGMMSSLVFDYVAKQKAGGNHMSKFIVNQLPVLAPEQIDEAMQWQIAKRVAQLCYFNHDLDGWAEEMWDEMNAAQRSELPQLGSKQPFIFEPNRRAVLQAELDAIFAHLYGLTTDELRYILDPEDVCGPGCINETFRVLKDNEIRQYGEYRTKRLVLAAWHQFHYHN